LFTAIYKEYHFRKIKDFVLNSNPEKLKIYGEHFVVGFTRLEEVLTLSEKGGIGGVFITTRNIKGLSASDIKEMIQKIQKVRKPSGLLELFIASDQEGGEVSRLSPPLTQVPFLGKSMDSAKDDNEKIIIMKQAGETHGKELGEIGVNLNLAPVLDLRNIPKEIRIDLHSRIWERAISENPEEVGKYAKMYSEILVSFGVLPAFKHFPGLARTSEDTHFFSAKLTESVKEFENHDWIPYKIVKNIPGFIMLGHIILQELDSENPVSISEKAIQKLRKENFNKAFITDDLGMGPVFYSKQGVGGASTSSLKGGMDLLLISYDPDLYYYAMYEILNSNLSKNELIKSKERLALLRKYFHPSTSNELNNF
jgi:beta-N-acetylhexosaminidase